MTGFASDRSPCLFSFHKINVLLWYFLGLAFGPTFSSTASPRLPCTPTQFLCMCCNICLESTHSLFSTQALCSSYLSLKAQKEGHLIH